MRVVQLSLLALGAVSVSSSASADRKSACWDTAVAQAERNACASTEAKAAQAEMETVFRDVLKKHSADPHFVRQLKAAQLAWLAFRDAELRARFPSARPERGYGSVFPMCWRLEHVRLFRERTKALRIWLDGPTDSDSTCAGSYPP